MTDLEALESSFDYCISQARESKEKQRAISLKRQRDGRRFFSAEEKVQLEELKEDYAYYMDVANDQKVMAKLQFNYRLVPKI